MCKKCQSKIGKMKRRTKSRSVRGIDAKSIVPTITTAAMAAAGLYLGQKLGGLAMIEKQNAYVKAGIKVAAGIALTMVKGNPYTSPIGVGLAAAGVMDVATEAGLKGVGAQRTWIAGVDEPYMQPQPIAVFQ